MRKDKKTGDSPIDKKIIEEKIRKATPVLFDKHEEKFQKNLKAYHGPTFQKFLNTIRNDNFQTKGISHDKVRQFKYLVPADVLAKAEKFYGAALWDNDAHGKKLREEAFMIFRVVDKNA